MSSTVNRAYTVCSFIGIVLSVIPLYWHLQGKLQFTNRRPCLNIKAHITAWNTGTCMYMIWTALGCLIYFINSILWRGNVLDKAPIYCDIGKAECSFPTHPLTDSPVTRLQVGIGIGIPACTLCMYRRLYKVLVRQAGAVTRDEKRRIVIIDLLITAGLPILAMGLRKCAQ
jgi:pheromone a factor receptor